jgi:hypothetical protein
VKGGENMIYDLDSRDGGKIIAQTGDTLGTGALKVDCLEAGKTAISILSTASGAPIKVTVINSAIDIDTVAASTVPGIDVRSGATIYPAITIGRTVNSALTQAAMKFLGTSVASAALMEFAGGFISLTSINYVAGGMNTDYALPVVVGTGEVRYIPLVKGAALLGGATFA